MSRRSDLYTRWQAADQAVSELIAGAQSATVSMAGGTNSYTRANLDALIRERDSLARQIYRLDRGGRPRILRVYSETEQ